MIDDDFFFYSRQLFHKNLIDTTMYSQVRAIRAIHFYCFAFKNAHSVSQILSFSSFISFL